MVGKFYIHDQANIYTQKASQEQLDFTLSKGSSPGRGISGANIVSCAKLQRTQTRFCTKTFGVATPPLLPVAQNGIQSKVNGDAFPASTGGLFYL